MLSEQMHTVMEEDRLLRDNAERILKGEYLED